jgi:hypothetical protein
MKLCTHAPLLDSILEDWRPALAQDFNAYKNHCYRVLNFCLALNTEHTKTLLKIKLDKISIAAAFHDLGIWTHQTFDYLAPSRQLAREFLANTDQDAWQEEIEAMIEQHHKIKWYKNNPIWLVEPFRKADWVDISKGFLKFGLPASFIKETQKCFPNAGFHKRLVALTWKRFKQHPFNPLPMMKL